MKTLREEIVELLMERIGVVENEEFKGKGINGKYHNFKFAYGELFIKYIKSHINTFFLNTMFRLQSGLKPLLQLLLFLLVVLRSQQPI